MPAWERRMLIEKFMEYETEGEKKPNDGPEGDLFEHIPDEHKEAFGV